MKPNQLIERSFIPIPVLMLALLVATANYAFGWDYGNGRHGSFVLTTNATIEQIYQSVRLTNDPAQYDPFDLNAIPNFQNLSITGATLTADPWNGTSGGQIVLKVQGTLSVAANSTIFVSGLGFRGGGAFGLGESFGDSANPQYGGGGGSRMSTSGFTITGAGGGGYGSVGGDGTCFSYNGVSYCSAGGATYGTASLDIPFLGSGGGGGGMYGNNGPAQNGGNGAGEVLIDAGQIQMAGQIQANGSGGGTGQGGGGGGSGGSIRLRTVSAVLGNNNVTANGGSGGIGSGQNGGNGGNGRIMIGYAKSYTGTTTPAAYTLLDTNSDNITTITIQPAAQTNFWSSNAVMTVGIAGYPPFVFQWYFNSTLISGATNQALVLTGLDFTNQGNYSVTISNAVMTVASSNAFLTVLDGRDFDGDGIPNYWEQQYGLNPNNPNDATNHPPGDLLTYLQKYFYGLNPLMLDTDGDGLSDRDELFVYGSNPLQANTSGDEIPDGWKVQYGLNLLTANANDEISSSGITYWQVYQYNLTHTNQLDPRNPFFAPSTSLYEALNGGQHTNRMYYDRNDRLVGEEFSRGLAIAYRYDGNDNLVRQTHLSRASETNGLPVLWRFLNGITNENPYADSDGDGWTDYQEWRAGSTPTNALSTPNLFANVGVEIASLTLPFTPSNFVVGTGQLDGSGAEEIVIGADGSPGTNANFLLVLTQAAVGWSTQRVDIGSLAITSIAVGQPAYHTNAAIYVGTRGTNGIGQVMEFNQSSGTWQSNIVAISTNDVVYVLGVRSGADLIASFSTNGIDAGLFSLTVSNNIWTQAVLSTNRSDKTLGAQGTVWSRIFRGASVRLVNTNQIELVAGDREAVKNNLLLPTNWVFNPTTGKFYFESTNTMSRDEGESFAQQYGTHLVTISDSVENYWLASEFSKPYWIGLYMEQNCCSVGLIYGAWVSSGQQPTTSYTAWSSYWENNPFYYFEGTGSYPRPDGVCVGLNVNQLWNCKLPGNQYRALADATGVQTYSNRWLLSSSPFPNQIRWKENQVALGERRLLNTNRSALVMCFVSDADSSGNVSADDDFAFAEYRISGDAVTLMTQTNFPVGSNALAQTFGTVAVDFLNSGSDVIFTAEPSGKIYSWSETDTNASLNRQIFTGAYAGKAWQALAGVRIAVGGQGLCGLMIDPTNQNACHVIFWPPQVTLATPQQEIVETAPSAAILPSPNPLGSNAAVTVRLWDSEGNASTPFLEYQLSGSTNWQNATITTLDGMAYSSVTRVAALPGGSNHFVSWNALADVGGNVVTNILLRARAQDFMLMGDWSQSTPFQLDTTLVANPNPTNAPVVFSGITLVPGGLAFSWHGNTNLTQYLQRSPALIGTNASWVNIWTGFPPTPVTGSYTDFFGTNKMEFYRLKIGTP
jgi:YD repeat-containing protein